MKKFLFLFLFLTNISFSQTAQELEAFGRLLNDAIFYCDRYITPASDASIYQASSGWVTSPKKRKLWDVTLGFNNNIFFVPKSDRKFEIKNSDFTFFSIRDANWNPVTSASVPTALGTNEQLNLVGNIGANQVYLQTPQGVNAEQVSTNKGANYSVFEPMTNEFRAVTTEGVEQVYTTFLDRVSAGRNMSFSAVDSIAQGRVWSGVDAKNIPEIMETGLPTSFKVLKLLTEVHNGGSTYSFQYAFESKQHYDIYEALHFDGLIANGARVCPNKFRVVNKKRMLTNFFM